MNTHGFFQRFRAACKPADAITKQDLLETERAILHAQMGMEDRIVSLLASLNALQVGSLKEMENRLTMNSKELSLALDALTTQQAKIAKEQSDRFDAQTAAIKDLADKLNAGDVSQDVKDSLARLQATTQALDDAIPDAPVPA